MFEKQTESVEITNKAAKKENLNLHSQILLWITNKTKSR